MKQYCRYCAHCSYGDVPYCEEYEKTMSEAQIKRVNRCPSFSFVNEDVESGLPYKPRKPKPKPKEDCEQISLMEV